MKKKKIMEFIINPRFFHSHGILYKGTYCVSFKLYHISANNTTTYAYPFAIPNPSKQQNGDRAYQEATIHLQSNFSFQTQRFSIVFQEDRRKLQTQCIFRLEYQQKKTYNTFLSCKILKKQRKNKATQSNYCGKSIDQLKYEVIDTQILKMNHIKRLNSYQKIYFHSAQFFSSIDVSIHSFDQGYKWYKSKQQLSNILSGYQLSKFNPLVFLQSRKNKNILKKQQYSYEIFQSLKGLANVVFLSYEELEHMINEYQHWYQQIIHFRDNRLKSHDQEGRKLMPLTLADLSYLQRGRAHTEADIRRIYGNLKEEEILMAILQEIELIRHNIRALRQYYCILLFNEPDKLFFSTILQTTKKNEDLRQQSFVRFQKILDKKNEVLRERASLSFENQILLTPEKIDRIPFLVVEDYEKPILKQNQKILALTVFVHGYQGNSFDFQKSKNYLKRYNRHTTVLILQSITPEMEKSIEQLGTIVASQVQKYLQSAIIHYEVINFIGFSLGGLIIRASLNHLQVSIRNRLGIFITFSSPHLGISNSDNSLVKLGVWYLIKVDKVKNLKQLNFQSVEFHDSLLAKMSRCPHISKFKKVVVVSSKDDGFVPLYSTFLERQLCQNQIVSLCDNLRDRIRKLQRVQVHFSTDHGGTIDKITGRKGHIQFLDNHYFLQQFFRLYAPYL